MLNRRDLLTGFSALAAGALSSRVARSQPEGQYLTKKMPGNGPALPVIGMGSSRTFDVGPDAAARAVRCGVLKTFFQMGGTIIDSSPMYGAAEEVIGQCLKRSDVPAELYAATKVWTEGKARGIAQMERSLALWGIKRFDLMQIHNLVDWRVHLETLTAWKSEGRIRHLGITTSHGRRHAEFESIMAEAPLDFVQLSYNILDRQVEDRLLPLARERGQAVMANRPFRRGKLFEIVKGKPVPAFAADFGCTNWAQFFLKFAVSHPDVTCAIPATSKVDHMRENMGANSGRLPDQNERAKMIQAMKDL